MLQTLHPPSTIHNFCCKIHGILVETGCFYPKLHCYSSDESHFPTVNSFRVIDVYFKTSESISVALFSQYVQCERCNEV